MRIGKVIEHNISITPTINSGFIVQVGCCSACFSNSAEMLAGLEEYLANPKEFEREVNEILGTNCPTPTTEGIINYMRRTT